MCRSVVLFQGAQNVYFITFYLFNVLIFQVVLKKPHSHCQRLCQTMPMTRCQGQAFDTVCAMQCLEPPWSLQWCSMTSWDIPCDKWSRTLNLAWTYTLHFLLWIVSARLNLCIIMSSLEEQDMYCLRIKFWQILS